MLLRRITQHLKDQNWFAVAIDFVIVVVGVFIGIQVANWNNSLRVQAEEERLVSQLSTDVGAAIKINEAWIAEIGAHREGLVEAISLAQNNSEQDALRPELCLAMWTSHVIIFPNATIATLEEILSSGGLSAISDKELRRRLLEYQSARDARKETYLAIRNDFANLIDNYPVAFPRSISKETVNDNQPRLNIEGRADEMGGFSTVNCDLDAIRADQAIQNKLISNLGRTDGLLRQAANEITMLRNIEASLGK